MQSFSIQSSKNDIKPAEINELTDAVGWGKRDEVKWQYILKVSSYVAYIRDDDGKLRAFGRVLEDGVMCMFYDIAVHPEWQSRKAGTAIMEYLVDKVKDKEYVSIGLFVWDENPSSKEFYEKFGFERVSTGMELTKHMKRE